MPASHTDSSSTHTGLLKYGGATNTPNLPGDRTPPLHTQKQTNEKTYKKHKELQDNRTTNKHCSSTTAKGNPNGTCQQTHPTSGSPPLMSQGQKPRTVQNQRITGRSERTRPNGERSKTGSITKTRRSGGRRTAGRPKRADGNKLTGEAETGGTGRQPGWYTGEAADGTLTNGRATHNRRRNGTTRQSINRTNRRNRTAGKRNRLDSRLDRIVSQMSPFLLHFGP